MHKKLINKGLMCAALAITVSPACTTTLQASKIMTGAFMGAGLGGICGGSDGILPGMMTGMAVGTMAEMADHSHCHHRPHHCHEVYYTHEVRPSRSSLEYEIDRLEVKLSESNKYARHLQHKIEQKDYEISKLERRIGHLEDELRRCRRDQSCMKTGFTIEAKAVSV